MGSDLMSEELPERRFRTLFISDVHLGARGSQADKLLDFLRVHDADTIYLVGDIVDGWALKSSWHWPQSHNDFVQKMLRKVRKGARVIYIPGNRANNGGKKARSPKRARRKPLKPLRGECRVFPV